MAQRPRPRPLVIAHAACPRFAAENSIEGIRQAREFGVDCVEIDVRMSRDGAVVLMHDMTPRRTAGGLLPVRAASLARLRRLRLRGTDEPVPTLAEALAALGEDLMIAIEIKEARATAATVAEVRRAGVGDRALLWSYAERSVRWCVRNAPELEVSLLRDTRGRSGRRRFVRDAAALGADGLSIGWGAIDAALIAETRPLGLVVYSMGPEPHREPERFRLVEGVITDWPAEAIAARAALPPVAS